MPKNTFEHLRKKYGRENHQLATACPEYLPLVLEVVAVVVVVEGEDDVVVRGGVEQLAHPLPAHLFALSIALKHQTEAFDFSKCKLFTVQ